MMLKKMFRKREVIKTVELKTYATGKVVELEQVSDPVFSQKMMGEGIAIEPNDGEIVSPVEGEIIQTLSTKHAVGIRADNGAEILIHIGLETVSMKGEGFSVHVKNGQKVKYGDALITVDLELLKQKNIDTVTPMIITNTDSMETIRFNDSLPEIVEPSQTMLTVIAK